MIAIAFSITQHIIQTKKKQKKKKKIIIINVNVSVKNIACEKKILIGILAHVFVRIVGI